MKRDDDDAPRTRGRHPYAGHDGSADVGGHPLGAEDDSRLEGTSTAAAPSAPEDGEPEPNKRDGDAAYNPQPTPKPAPVEAWYGPAPARLGWRKAIGILAVLAGAIALGLWLAWPETLPWQAQQATSPPGVAEEEEPELEVVLTPSARALRPTPTPVPSVRPSRTPSSPRPTPSRTPPSSRPTPSKSVVPSPKPTVTVTRKVTVTPTPTVRVGGPEEPPATRASTGPSADCVTWSDCHDEPPDQ